MKKNIFLLCCLFAGGCAIQTISEPPVLAGRLSPKGDLWPTGGGQGTGMSRSLKDPRLTRINSVRVGMTSLEVAATMGEKTTIGYERPDPASSAYHPVTVSNPYHKEFLRGADKTYDVFYYFSHIQRADGIISSDELTPLVFEKDILIGKGWDFLNKLKDQKTAK